jgi:hypothetical protein
MSPEGQQAGEGSENHSQASSNAEEDLGQKSQKLDVATEQQRSPWRRASKPPKRRSNVGCRKREKVVVLRELHRAIICTPKLSKQVMEDHVSTAFIAY